MNLVKKTRFEKKLKKLKYVADKNEAKWNLF